MRSKGPNTAFAKRSQQATCFQQRIYELRCKLEVHKVSMNRAAVEILPIPFNENHIIVELGKIAGLVPEPPSKLGSKIFRSRVAALTVLSDIFLLRAKNIAELNRFHGWTADDKQYFFETGLILPGLLPGLTLALLRA